MNPESETTRLCGKRIRLLPTKAQEVLFWKSAGTSRWAYNYFLTVQERAYKEYLERGKTGTKSISEGVVRKHINNELKPTTHQWLKDVGSNVMKQAVKEAAKSFTAYMQGVKGKPRLKKKHKTKPSFYVNYESLKWRNGGFHGEKIGFVRTAEPLPRLSRGKHYSNPWISFDGKYWYLGFGYEVTESTLKEQTGNCIGIDLGIKSLAVCYVSGADKQQVFKNINKTREVRRLEKKIRREQRKKSRKMVANTDHYEIVQREGKKAGRKPVWKRPLRECPNIERQRQKIALLYRRLKNIRNNYLHQTTTAIVKTKPSRIVIEDLNIKSMMKNKHLAKAIADQKFYEFRRQLTYKCERHGIQLVIADQFYPSSKTCSCCGHIKRDLKLTERTYHCPVCGNVIDRDLNAAINLANYGKSETV